jgi:FkbM family methyltransferase
MMGFYSQFGQDSYLREQFFSGVTGGVFVDVGAGDGVTDSNTLHFEEEGWSGLLVEAHPDIFKKLVEARKSLAENVCCANFTGKKFFQLVPVQGWSGLDDFIRKFDEEEMERIEEAGPIGAMPLPCFPLRDLLEKHGIREVDYLSVDVEGAELSVLESVDWESVEIRVITVEINRTDGAIGDFLTSHGYRLWSNIGPDEVYVLRRWADTGQLHPPQLSQPS